MEKEYYMNAGIPAQGLSEPGMQPWNSFSLPQELNSNSQFISSFLLNSHWEKEIDHFTQFQSTLGPVALPTSSVVDDAVGIREFIAKLGPIRNSGCADTNGWNAKQQGVPIFNEFVKRNSPNIANSLLLDPPLPALSTDPEFAERAAKFSCFGSHSFNVKRNHSTLTDVESPHRSNSAMARVWSSPSLKQDGSPIENRESCQTQMEIKKFDRLPSIGPNSNDCSSISEQVPSGDTVSKVPNEIHSRKRKTVPKSKAKENISPTVDSHQVGEADDAKNEKRPKIAAETCPNEIGNINREEEEKKKAKDGVNEALNEQHKPDMVTQKSTEPQKDYIHVRARRGQATDSHSLAERVRREKIGERMKLLQDLVPGCNKVTGKALMLDEIINYVQSLQCQVEFLSMKLASVDSRQEVNVDNFSSKDVIQRNGSFYRVESTIPGSYAHQQKQYPQMHNDSSLNQCPVEPLIKTPSHNLEVRLPSLNEFVDCLPQFPAFCEEDLHSIVGMGYGQNAVKESDFIQ